MDERLDLPLLRAFSELVETASVTAAAERLHLSVPATSRALGRLRRVLGDPVLVRAGRGMVATPYALRVAPRVRAVLEDVASLTTADRAFRPADVETSFRIRINDGVAATLAPRLVAAVAAAAPAARLRFVAEGTEADEAMRDGSVDLDVGVGESTAPDLRSAELYRETSVVIVRADSALGRRRRPGLEDLCRPAHVAASRRGRARGPFDDALEAAGHVRRVAAVVPSFTTVALLVAGSDHAGLVPRRFAEEHADRLGLAWFAIPLALPALVIRMSWHARLDADPAQQWLRQCVQEVVRPASAR